MLQRFDRALRAAGSVYDSGAAKMRLDRVFNPRMRKPISESTKAALACALDMTLDQFDQLISAERKTPVTNLRKAPTAGLLIRGRRDDGVAEELRERAAELKSHARKLESLARKLHGKRSHRH
jgi:hypothetical protein